VLGFAIAGAFVVRGAAFHGASYGMGRG